MRLTLLYFYLYYTILISALVPVKFRWIPKHSVWEQNGEGYRISGNGGWMWYCSYKYQRKKHSKSEKRQKLHKLLQDIKKNKGASYVRDSKLNVIDSATNDYENLKLLHSPDSEDEKSEANKTTFIKRPPVFKLATNKSTEFGFNNVNCKWTAKTKLKLIKEIDESVPSESMLVDNNQPIEEKDASASIKEEPLETPETPIQEADSTSISQNTPKGAEFASEESATEKSNLTQVKIEQGNNSIPTEDTKQEVNSVNGAKTTTTDNVTPPSTPKQIDTSSETKTPTATTEEVNKLRPKQIDTSSVTKTPTATTEEVIVPQQNNVFTETKTSIAKVKTTAVKPMIIKVPSEPNSLTGKNLSILKALEAAGIKAPEGKILAIRTSAGSFVIKAGNKLIQTGINSPTVVKAPVPVLPQVTPASTVVKMSTPSTPVRNLNMNQQKDFLSKVESKIRPMHNLFKTPSSLVDCETNKLSKRRTGIPSLFTLQKHDLRRLARGKYFKKAKGFLYNIKSTNPTWPEAIPRPTFRMAWRYNLAKAKHFSSIAHLFRILYSCIQWEVINHSPDKGGKRVVTSNKGY